MNISSEITNLGIGMKMNYGNQRKSVQKETEEVEAHTAQNKSGYKLLIILFENFLDLDDKKYGGIANMGTRPTVDGQNPVLEVHILDFSGNLYGKKITVEFLKKVRDEKKFDGLEALKEQIFKDISFAKEYFS